MASKKQIKPTGGTDTPNLVRFISVLKHTDKLRVSVPHSDVNETKE